MFQCILQKSGCQKEDILTKLTGPNEGEIKEERFRLIYGSLRFTIFISNPKIIHRKIMRRKMLRNIK